MVIMYVIVQYVLFALVQVALRWEVQLLIYLSHIAKNVPEVMCLDTFFVILEANKYISEAAMSKLFCICKECWYIVGTKL